MRKFILLILVLFSISTLSVYAAEEQGVEDLVEAVEAPSDIGFFENIVVGIFDFVTSEEFTKLATSIFFIISGTYPFYRRRKDNRYRLHIQILKDERDAERKRAENAEDRISKYEKLIELQTANTEAITDSLILGFDRSSLREDVKDKIMSKLHNVPKLEVPKKDLEPIINEEKDNLLTEAVEDTQVKTGW